MPRKPKTQASPTQPIKPPAELDFYAALRRVLEGSKLTRLAWNDPGWYITLSDNKLCIHKPDSILLHPLIVGRGDLEGTDWVIV